MNNTLYYKYVITDKEHNRLFIFNINTNYK